MGDDEEVKPPPPPGPSPQEEALLAEQVKMLKFQADLLQKQLKEQAVLAKVLFPKAGFAPKFSAEGELIGLEEVPSPLAPMEREVQELFLKKTLAALKGEVPEDPGLVRELGESEASLRERLRGQLGPGYETSTPGMQSLAEFRQRKTEILAGARRGELTLAEQLGLAREQAMLAKTMGTQATLQDVLGGKFTGAQTLGQIASGYGQAAAPYQAYTLAGYQGGLQTALMNARIAAQPSPWIGAIGKGLGTLATLYAPAPPWATVGR